MKLFLIGWGNLRPEIASVIEDLQKDHEILYWVRMDRVFKIEQSLFPKTIFHEYTDAIKGCPAEKLQDLRLEPLSREFIHTFSQTEAEILTMTEKWYESWSINKRKYLYY